MPISWLAGQQDGAGQGTETITITKGATLSPAERLRRASQIRRRTQRTQERCVPFDYFAIHTLVIVIITMAIGGGRERTRWNCFKNFHKWLIKFDVTLERDERSVGTVVLLVYVYVCFVLNFGSVCFIDCWHTIQTIHTHTRTHWQYTQR